MPDRKRSKRKTLAAQYNRWSASILPTHVGLKPYFSYPHKKPSHTPYTPPACPAALERAGGLGARQARDRQDGSMPICVSGDYLHDYDYDRCDYGIQHGSGWGWCAGTFGLLTVY